MKNKPFILSALCIIISMGTISAKAQDTTNRFERTLPNTSLSKPTDTTSHTQSPPVNLNPPNTPATLQGNNSTPGNPQPATPIYNNPNNSPANNPAPPPHSSSPF